MVGVVLSTLWYAVTLPFRLVFWTAALLGRATGLALGFTMMVVGFALTAGPYAVVGVPVFLLGLVLTLRSVG
jgi:hypothetical protein